jgi:hypothetical protein
MSPVAVAHGIITSASVKPKLSGGSHAPWSQGYAFWRHWKLDSQILASQFIILATRLGLANRWPNPNWFN